MGPREGRLSSGLYAILDLLEDNIGIKIDAVL